VKPWLLPNIDPTGNSSLPIFDSTTGAIQSPTLVGKGWPGTNNPNGLFSLCGGDCSSGIQTLAPPGTLGGYYPGAVADFPAPTQALPACSSGLTTPYQFAVAGCVQQTISCGATATVNIDTTTYASSTGTRDGDTVAAAACLIHYVSAAGDSDSVDPLTTRPPLQFVAGIQNPVASAVGQNVMVSDSLVTIPVINNPPPSQPTNPVTVIGFLQVFLNPSALAAMPPPNNQIPVTIVNMAGCGTGATGQPILGNGASPVAVRLISPP
jgi:hypothetical protein